MIGVVRFKQIQVTKREKNRKVKGKELYSFVYTNQNT